MLVQPMSPDVLVWLVNEWGSVPRAAAGEDQAPYPDTDLLAALLAGSGVRSCPPAALTLPALRQVADQLHRVFAAAGLGERVALVAALLAGTAVRPALEMDLDLAEGRPSATWRVDDAPHVLLAAAALTLRDQLAEHEPDRIGVCSGRRCADAFIDASPAGQRRFCSVTCQNRARVAAWRQRQSSPHQSSPHQSSPHQSSPHQSSPHQSSQRQNSQAQG
jgi:predicted RNA-binding Zn ribbon-like protein